MRGSVAMKIDEETAHVCLGEKDVKVGDDLYFYKSVCPGGVPGGDYATCQLKVLGKGFVTKLLNNHYSEVKTDGTFKFEEGVLVQKEKL